MHAQRHLNSAGLTAIADLDIEKSDDDSSDIEKEAIHDLASKLQINPAIVAGRLRFERNDYQSFARLIGNGQVRRAFPDISWEGV